MNKTATGLEPVSPGSTECPIRWTKQSTSTAFGKTQQRSFMIKAIAVAFCFLVEALGLEPRLAVL